MHLKSRSKFRSAAYNKTQNQAKQIKNYAYHNKVTSLNMVSHIEFVTGILLTIIAKEGFFKAVFSA